MKQAKPSIIKARIARVARVVTVFTFLILAVLGVSSVVKALSLESIANENGIPASWEVASLGNPETITVPITYWDQRQDECGAENRQFEWTMCNITASTAQQGLVQDQLGADGLPVPAYTSAAETRAAGVHKTSRYVTGHNPVQTTDNFYRWFHNTELSQSYEREVTFTRTGNNTYTYGGADIFPLDNVDFSADDSATRNGHNFHFTAHLSVPVKIAADGTERFDFAGDDDVWVFLNDQLVLDIGGLHTKLSGWFTVNNDGTLTTYVETAGTKTIDIGLEPGDVVNLDFFYAERSTSASNTLITITGMNWPISADSDVDAKLAYQFEDSDKYLVEFNSSISNRDPENAITLERLAAYINETTTDPEGESPAIVTTGYLPLDADTISYTTTPSDPDSWQPLELTAPANSTSGFNLVTPLTLAPDGSTGDTIYFRYFAETSGNPGTTTLRNQTNFYTTLDGAAGVTYDYDTVEYTVVAPEPEPEPEPKPEPKPEPEEPEEPDTPVGPTDPENPDETDNPDGTDPSDDVPTIPDSDIIDDNLVFLPPLGEVVYVPNTGVISDAVAAIFEAEFASVVLSQGFIMAVLLIFAGSFALYFSFRQYLQPATRRVSRNTRSSSGTNRSRSARSNSRTIKSAKTTRSTKSRKSRH